MSTLGTGPFVLSDRRAIRLIPALEWRRRLLLAVEYAALRLGRIFLVQIGAPESYDAKAMRPQSFLLFALTATATAFSIPACSKGAPQKSAVTTSTSSSGGRTFDAGRAWRLLNEQVDLGPRPAGSGKIEKLRELMTRELEAAGCKVVREEFPVQTVVGEQTYVNLYVDLPPTEAVEGTPEMVILVTHFDTKNGLPFRFLGANDGASGTAVQLELAHALRGATAPARNYTLRLLFVDGEEAIGDWDPIRQNNTYGSRHHARILAESGEAKNVRACIVLDMVGDAGLQFATDSRSDRRLLELAFQCAEEIGLGAHVNGVRKEIYDDHLSFIAVGIPSIDLIDADFGPVTGTSSMGAYWHTAGDTPANCSQASLDATGRIVLALLPKLN